jgi:uncharacterized protein YbjT (DUF2867 family)
MNILLFGATGRTGKHIAQKLISAGHSVTAAGRRDPQINGVTFRPTDLADAATLAQLAQGMDGAISALAAGKGNPVCSRLAQALGGVEGLRFVTIGGAGVDAQGDEKGISDRFIAWMMRRIVPAMLADRQAELAILQNSRLRWTMLRPPRLTDKPAKGAVTITFDKPATTAISRTDLAQAAVDALADQSLIGRAPFVAG